MSTGCNKTDFRNRWKIKSCMGQWTDEDIWRDSGT
jgi:hypothetical protein